MTLFIFILSLFGAMILGVPIAFSLLITAVVLMFYLGNFDTQIITKTLADGADNYSLMAIPFFILAGEFMSNGGISIRIVNFAKTLVGNIKGGLGYVAIISSVIFASLSGSAVADTAALGSILIPMMVESGYRRSQSSALIASSGIIAPIIPPSIPLILFGVTGGVSITKLFLAGIVPGLMMGVGLVVVWFLVSRKEEKEEVPRPTLKSILTALKDAAWALLIPIVIVVGLRFGVFTPTEAAVVAAFIAFFIGTVVYKELKLKQIYDILLKATKTSSIVMFLTVTAMVVAWQITRANIPGQLSELLGKLVDNQTLLLLVIVLITFFIGMVMDLNPIVLILTPILMPVIELAGINPVYFGIIFIMTTVVGLITPPVGAVLNVICGVGNVEMDQIFKPLLPFLAVHILVLIILILFPNIVILPLHWLT
ncbi:MAG TPA: TRAP transporter large permease subunit [Pseudogracilibacillus sp.]|nr:TRAP transporter large permease subunit [Pseudogracilibacillus sp.]